MENLLHEITEDRSFQAKSMITENFVRFRINRQTVEAWKKFFRSNKDTKFDLLGKGIFEMIHKKADELLKFVTTTNSDSIFNSFDEYEETV